MIGALYSGVLAEAVEPTRETCPTGNCTWPISPSMAICGSCVNTSWVSSSCVGLDCTYTFASGSSTTLYNFEGYGKQSNNGSQAVAGFQVVPGRGAIFNASRQDRLYIMNIDLIGAPYWSFADRNPPISSRECALWLCINAYKTTVDTSVQTTSIVASHDRLDASWLTMKTSALPADGGTWYEYPMMPKDLNAGTTGFTSRLWAYMALQQYMYTAINGTVYWSQSQHFSNDLIRGIWNGTTDIDRWIDNVATSMSNVVRTTNKSCRPEYSGTALALTVQVRWLWLILPASLVVLSIVYLASVMIRTSRSSVQSWKGSPLTLLLFDVDSATRMAAHGQIHKRAGIKEAIGDRKIVMLTEGQTGMRTFQAL